MGIGESAIGAAGKELYQDLLHPVLAPTGKVLGLIPRAINLALSPLEKWLSAKEYNVEETKKLLEKKLENVDPETIVPPEPYIAVPAMQYISYCQDNPDLRDMYAELLAKSMQEDKKDLVHPGYLEIIKQLSPDEAMLLKNAYDKARRFTSKLKIPGKTLMRYIDNLLRLGLIKEKKIGPFTNFMIIDQYVFTNFGGVFCKTCISREEEPSL